MYEMHDLVNLTTSGPIFGYNLLDDQRSDFCWPVVVIDIKLYCIVSKHQSCATLMKCSGIHWCHKGVTLGYSPSFGTTIVTFVTRSASGIIMLVDVAMRVVFSRVPKHHRIKL